jgi:hypothetical protein
VAEYQHPNTALRNSLWKLKVPLKIKIFMWLLNRKVLLTKDNLKKRRWVGCTKCVFCDSQELVEHLFITCPLARLVWRVVHFTFNISPPTNVTNMFGNWLNGIDKKVKSQIRIGVCALVWTIWNCQNDVVFSKSGKFFAGNTQSFILDPLVVLPPTCGAAGVYGFRMYSVDGIHTGYL